jgi:methylated-DNA-protein-cysteine methyltransferase-like protein
MNWNSVFTFVKKIPRGRVITYGQLAKALHLPGGARTAGRAMAASPSGRGVPWHRVVGAGGRLLIREPHASLQRKLLESEGLRLAEKRILNFRNYEWMPGNTRRHGSPARKKSR